MGRSAVLNVPESIGRVVSVNVGRPRDVAWRGTMVRTGFFKHPVAGRVPLVGAHLAGDGQADLDVHGGVDKALFVYPLGHYNRWSPWLGGHPELGAFGENLTVDGLDEDDVALGDVIQIGTAILVVTEPRQPCYKVDVRLGRDGAAAHMIRTGMTGFYLGLVQTGDVGSGDDVIRLRRPPAEFITPAAVHRLGTTTRSEDIVELERVAKDPHLPIGLARDFQAKAERLRARDARRRELWHGFRRFTVERLVEESSDVRSLYLAPMDGAELPAIDAGQFVTVAFPAEADGGTTAVRRAYTISARTTRRTMRISVRHTPGGEGSGRAHGLVPGQVVEVSSPTGSLNAAAHPLAADAVLFSAGIGITPIVPMAAQFAERGVRTTVVHCARDARDAALLAELRELAALHSHVRVLCHVTDLGSMTPSRAMRPGRLTVDTVREVLAQPAASQVYLCGPADFMTQVRASVVGMGVPEECVHVEAFVSPTGDQRLVEPPPGGYEVTFAVGARTLLWADARTTLLDLAEEAGADIVASCRQGVCGTCHTRVLSGAVEYVREPTFAADEGYCLPCVAVPSARIALDA